MLIHRMFHLKSISKSFKMIQSLKASTKNALNLKQSINVSQLNQPIFTSHLFYRFSKQKILEQFQRLNQQLDIKASFQPQQDRLKQKQNEFLQKQQKIVKDFLQLTEQSFNEQLQNQLKEKYHVDAQMLLMIISSLEDPNVIRGNLVKLYPFVSIFEKTELLLFFELILVYKPQNLPPLSTVIPKPLQSIQSILLMLSEIYSKQQRIIEWIKQIPLYKGKNLCMMATGFFAIYQKMDQHLKFKNQRTIQRCIDRIVHLAADQDDQTKVSVVIMALQSPQTCHFAEQLLIELQTIDSSEIDPLKLQLFFIYLQRHLASAYAEVRKQAKSKTKYKILQESEQGEVTQKQEEEYQLSAEGQSLQYSKISEIEKFKFLNSLCKRTLIKIMDLNWKQTLKLNLLLQYWKLLQGFEATVYPFNSFQSKIVTFTTDKQIIKKLTNLTNDEILEILQTMEKLRINKSQLLIKCLAILSEKLDVLDSSQLITLSRVCVTFVRQCEDFLITIRKEIENRKFIFKEEEIDNLNVIFKRVLVLFPRPLVK